MPCPEEVDGIGREPVAAAVAGDCRRGAVETVEPGGEALQAVADGAQAILWPESSTPYLFNEDPVQAEAVRALVAAPAI